MQNNPNRTGIIIGTLLLAAGILSLLGQLLSPSIGYLWPVTIIGVGLAFYVGMLIGGRSFGALAIPGTVITGIGLILFLQNYLGAWETWSYAWALVISLVGIGLVIYGTWSDLPDLKSNGWNVARVGFILFIVFGIMFEFIFALSGESNLPDPNGLLWPMILILLGLGMIITRTYRLFRNNEEDQRADLNLFWPVIFIGAGILWAMVRVGMIETSDLTVLISLWPVLLIAAGVNLLVGRRFQWINLILGILVVLSMFYVVINNNNNLSSRTPWGILGISISDSQPINQWITGSGEIIKETREVDDFTQVVFSAAGELIITQGEKASLTIEAEKNLQPYMVTDVKGNQLIIKAKPGIGFSTSRPIRYYLTVTDLEAITLTGAGSVNVNDLVSQDLNIRLSGFGVIDLNEITNETLDVGISGSGSVNGSGTTQRLDVTISGAGNFNGSELKSEEASVYISGLGRVTVWATDNLDTNISGLGFVSYYGSPQISQSENGLGNVSKAGDK